MTSKRIGAFPTEKQLEVLVAVASCWSSLGVSPSSRRLAWFLGRGSEDGVRHIVDKLIDRGLLRRRLKRDKSKISLTDLGHTIVYGECEAAA